MRSLWRIVGLALALALAPGGASAADVVEQLPNSTPISHFGDTAVWSSKDPATNLYRLVAYRGGQQRVLPVAPRSVPFDVDLGPGPDGGLSAVYSRCREEPRSLGVPPIPAYTTGRGCDIYRFELSTERETKLSGASTNQASEMLPSIWRNEIAFARAYEQREGQRDGLELSVLPYLYVRCIDNCSGKTGSRRQRGGFRGRTGLPGPIALDLYGVRLGFIWSFQGSGETSQYRARMDTTTGGHRVIAETGGGGLSRSWFVSAAFDRGRFFFGMDCFGDPGGCGDLGRRRKLLRYRISTGELTKALLPGPGDTLLTVSREHGETFYVRERSTGNPGRPCVGVRPPGEDETVCEVVRIPEGELSFRSTLRLGGE